MWAIYECDKIERGQQPQNEIDTGERFADSGEAWARVATLKAANPGKSFTLGIDD